MRKILLLLCLVPLVLSGKVRSVDHFEEINRYVKPGSWVIVDIDGTLIDAAQMLGSTHWLYDHLSRLVHEEGLAPAEAAFVFEEKLGSVRASVPFKPMEEGIPALIADLQERGHVVFALTHRPLSMCKATKRHLASCGIDLKRTSPIDGDACFSDLSRMHDGVIFVSDFGPKGRTLSLLLQELAERPREIVFVDDSEHNVTSVAQMCEELKIPCHAFYYQQRNKRHADYSRAVADIQLAALPQVLSDNQARLSLRCGSGSAG